MEAVYKITVHKWDDHNPKHKKSFKKFMFYNGFFSDVKIAQLRPTEVLIYVYLLCVCSESGSNQCQISVKSVPKQFRISSKSLSTQLTRLQSLQLVTLEKMPLNELKEMNRRDIKEMNITAEANETGQTQLFESDPPPVKKKALSTQVSKAAHRGCIPEFSHDEVCQDFLKNVTHRAQTAWLKAYPSVDWIVHEVRKANAWCETNPQKAPKDNGKFMVNWLSRAFESFRKGLPSNGPAHNRVQASNDALREKIRRGEL